MVRCHPHLFISSRGLEVSLSRRARPEGCQACSIHTFFPFCLSLLESVAHSHSVDRLSVSPSYPLQVLPGRQAKVKGYFSTCLSLLVLHSPYVGHSGEQAHCPPTPTQHPTAVGRCHQCGTASLENPLSVQAGLKPQVVASSSVTTRRDVHV